MKIKRFELIDRATGWHLEETAFDAFNLLVGISGVGKTKIVEGIRRVQRFAIDEDFDPGAMEWALAFEHEGTEYRWEGGTAEEPDQLGKARARVVREVLSREGEVLVERTRDAISFGGTLLPKLTRSDSAISLFSDEEAIAPVIHAFRHFVFSEMMPTFASTHDSEKNAIEFRSVIEGIKEKSTGSNSIPSASEEGARTGLLTALLNSFWQPEDWRSIYLYVVQELIPSDFAAIKELFTAIFPFIEDLRVAWTRPGDSSLQTIRELQIRERDVADWISGTEMSTGMLRTLSLIIDIHAAPPGSVLLIDEVENSLGVNCMPEVIDFLLERGDCQFILTSHHPYIIDNIPVQAWKLVRRHGSEVSITPVTSLPDFDASSRHRAFLKLINLPAFEEGIA